MEICSFCYQAGDSHRLHLLDDNIYMHIHFSSQYLQRTRNKSNKDTPTTLKYMGVLFQHAPYQHNIDSDFLQAFLSALLHQYDDYT